MLSTVVSAAQCGSSVAQLGRSKQRGRKELTKVCASWRKWKGHRAEEKVPASPERSREPSTAYSPLLLLAHLSRKAQRQEVDSPGPSSALTDSSTVLHCWHQGHRNQFFCLLPSRLIFPQLHDASCGDGWMTAVSGPYHHRECENAVRHQRSCSVSALCAGSSTLRRKKVHLCAGHASVSWTPEPGPQHRQGPSTHRSLKNPLFGRARGCGQYQPWPLQKVCPW